MLLLLDRCLVFYVVRPFVCLFVRAFVRSFVLLGLVAVCRRIVMTGRGVGAGCKWDGMRQGGEGGIGIGIPRLAP